MAKKSKYYVVWSGVKPGIYNTWEDCQLQITGFEKARYKSYESYDEALLSFKAGKDTSTKKIPLQPYKIEKNSICVDAACSGNPGNMEYRGVETSSGRQIFHVGPLPDGTNNVGEFLALVHALALLKKLKKEDTLIYTDSQTAMAWVRDKKIKSTLERTSKNKEIFDMLERALLWLKNNSYQNKIIKWDTVKWGEIPADFGRK
ncbi:MAG: ribonuclease H family protein [Saprospiraceae bacterium]|nr:ribonuclease H family protein [Saprospiraceae bacterium]